ncbi:GNAT family N-acetyltransferase [Streptomyces sp. NPDC088157]|uniref:GNAT family N-acetyltransferase n=1 Tax=Streptomyces sp. NPDC088157 TaxID=3365832 RepID=UPI00381AADBE
MRGRGVLAHWPRPDLLRCRGCAAALRHCSERTATSGRSGCRGEGFVAEDVPELSVGVLPPWRGQGVGRALLTELARRAVEHGFARVSLSVERANHARRLYVTEGFTTVESGPDSDTMVMVLSER